MSWLFGGSSAPKDNSQTDKSLPELPPGLQTLPPPPPPKGAPIPSGPFTGFSEPPPSPPQPAGASRGAPLPLSFAPPTAGTDYSNEDFSKYT
ncbi:hypothetical protein ENH_00078850 [Eimeria necatrix]|uniref:Uncharacterized protein n=1 Tax=Eimeria necatrix TaxID=51315 RepID=U6N632_9EIME|nr:hypothetical protein ENH_00078850 [Eimeria necatrix]CDJ70140.1 hypothetical protein ENH_00078850 [Eimeria necatrix]